MCRLEKSPNIAWLSIAPKRRYGSHATVVSKGGYASLLTQQAGLTPKLYKVRLTPALRTTWALRNLKNFEQSSNLFKLRKALLVLSKNKRFLAKKIKYIRLIPPKSIILTTFFNNKKIKNMVKKLFFLLFVVFSELLAAQSCYIQGDDMQGFDVKQYLPNLEQAACNLKAKFPTTFKDKFKVASYGLPTISSQAIGASEYYETYLSDKTAKVADFYLLFIRSPVNGYPNEKYIVKIKLPTTGEFTCINEDKLSQINLKIENAVKIAVAKIGKNPNDHFKVEIEVMKSFATLIEQISQGNCDILTKDEIFTFLDEKGFLSAPCKIKGINSQTVNPLGPFNVTVTDKANLSVERIDVPNQDIAFKYLAEYAVNLYDLEGKSSKGFITNTLNQFSSTESEFGTNNSNIWWHIWDNPNPNEDDYFFIKRNDETKNLSAKVGNCNPDWEKCPCYNFETNGTKSGVFYIFGTKNTQSWDYESPWCGTTTFTLNYINNFDYISNNLGSLKHKSRTLNKCFDWSDLNEMTNNVYDREKAAMKLAEYIKNNLPDNEKDDKTIPITLIGYSHGGNVAIQAAPILYALTGKKVNLITLATPTSNFTSVQYLNANTNMVNSRTHRRYSENISNPSIQNALNVHYHFWIKDDHTAGWGSYVLEGSQITYKNSFTKNFEIDANCHPVPSSIDDYISGSGISYLLNGKHGFPYYKECIQDKLSNWISNGTIIRQ